MTAVRAASRTRLIVRASGKPWPRAKLRPSGRIKLVFVANLSTGPGPGTGGCSSIASMTRRISYSHHQGQQSHHKGQQGQQKKQNGQVHHSKQAVKLPSSPVVTVTCGTLL